MGGLWKLWIPIVLASLAALACGGGGDDDAETPTSSPGATVLGASSGEPTDEPAVVGTCASQTYEVQPGDTLSQIAEDFGVTVVAIAGASRLDNPDVLEVGQELTIPCLDDDEDGPEGAESVTPEP